MKHASHTTLPLVAPTRAASPGMVAGVIMGVAILLVPVLTLAVAAGTLVLQAILIAICNLTSARRGDAPARDHRAAARAPAPWLSIHIAARNEPPEVLIATLESLREQVRAPDHEVIVVINNTPSPKHWHPIADWCRPAGPRFRFLRRDNVFGAKAGALEIALQHTAAATSHIVVLDADYRVVPEFLSLIGQELNATGADFLQFPQAYRHMSARTAGLSFELAEYFNRHARAANLADAMLPTGTLSVIRRDALKAVGGWPTRSCTEDAELGTALIAAGYRGVFVDRVVGRGLMPLDLRNLHRQRARWAAGNARVLVEALRRWLPGGRDAGAGPLQRLLVVAQLATWLNLGAIAVVTLIAGVGQAAIGGWTGQGAALADATILLSAATMALILLATVYPMLSATLPRVPVAVRLQALASRLSMVPVAACATIEGVRHKRQEFRITAKTRPSGAAMRLDGPLFLTASLGVALITVAVLSGDPVIALAGGLLLLPPLGGLAIQAPLSRYAADVSAQEA